MTKHTPGPWISVPHLDEFDIFDAPGANRICGYVTTKQNANIIAAAPEMYKALKAAHRSLIWVGGSALPRVKAAIAKAEGRDE